MLESLFSLSSPRVYLLGALLMAARTFWKTRPRRCTCCSEVTKPYVVTVENRAYDLRYFLVFLFAAFWPAAVLALLVSRLRGAFSSGPSDDDPRHT